MRHTAYFFVERISPVNQLIKSLEAPDRGFPSFGVGATVKVSVRIVEGGKERTQAFQGVVIRIRQGDSDSANNRNFTVRRIASHGIGVERTFLFRSPRVEKIEVLREAKVRRAQLYYLRNRSGKAARLKEKRMNA
ncbi:MAG: 50S ribosomal protein L19 [Phototrophicaceae bacterium]